MIDKFLELYNSVISDDKLRVTYITKLLSEFKSIEVNELNKEIEDFIQKSQARINSIALIHHNFYNNDDFTKIEFNNYLIQLVNSIKLLENNKLVKVKFVLIKFDFFLDIEIAIPLGLILNELISNSFKYAFKNEEDYRQIKITIIEEQKNRFSLFYEDNGIGFNDSEIESSSIGIKLINILVKQIDGNISHTNENGTKYKITFSKIS
jgi:two-component sensor histidine kinase